MPGARKRKRIGSAAQPTERWRKHKKRPDNDRYRSYDGWEFYVTDESTNDLPTPCDSRAVSLAARPKSGPQRSQSLPTRYSGTTISPQSQNQILKSVTTSSCALANKFLAKCNEAGKNNPELSETLAIFVDQLRCGETRFYSTRQPGVRLEVP